MGGQEQRLPVRLSKHPQLGWRIDDDRFPELSRKDDSAPSAAATKSVVSPPPAQPDARPELTLARLIAEPARYVNQPMRLFSEKGSAVQGQFAGVDEQGQLVLRQRLNGSGEARFTIAPADVVHVERIDE